MFTIVLIDSTNEAINEGCDYYDSNFDENDGNYWLSWDTTQPAWAWHHETTPWPKWNLDENNNMKNDLYWKRKKRSIDSGSDFCNQHKENQVPT